MKKTLKIIAIIAIMLVAVFALTGCGNKLIATKDVEGTESEPKHSEKIEISFKDDKVNKVKMTYTFDNKDDTKKFVDSNIRLSKCFCIRRWKGFFTNNGTKR